MNSEEIDFDLNSILEEEEIPEVHNVPVSHTQSPSSLAEIEAYKSKLEAVTNELGSIKKVLESGKKSNYMEDIFRKYGNIDPDFKALLAETLHGYNQMSLSEMKPLYDYFDKLSKELTTTKQELQAISQNVQGVQTNIAFDKLVRQYLQRGFKKHQVTEDHVDAAKKEHFKRLEKDESYFLKVTNIIDKKNLPDAQKDKLIGQMIMENFREVIIKKQSKGKLTENDPTPKQRIEKDASVEAAQKKADKETETEEKRELTDAEKEARRDALRAKLQGLKNI